MRAIAFLCLLHAVFHETSGNPYSWYNGRNSQSDDDNAAEVCVADKSACGCCLMKTTMERMKQFLTLNKEDLGKCLNKSKTLVNNMRDGRSAFSVSLNNVKDLTCHGPFASHNFIAYKHVFLNWGNGYNDNTGIFTAPRSGLYSFAVTMYSTNSTGQTENTCANLVVNGVATELREKYSQDPEDSNTVVIAMKLGPGEEVAVNLRQGCIICDSEKHYNTFTGFLVYATDEMS